MRTIARRVIVPLVILGAANVGSAQGQTVRGVVSHAATGEPLVGALVEVIGDSGARVGGVLSGPGGHYSVSASNGSSVQASFVGMTPAHQGLGSLLASDTVFVDLRLTSRPFELGGLSVLAEERCGGDAMEVVEIERVWREARTALESIEWAAETSAFRYDVQTHVRRLDSRARRVVTESRQELPAWGAHPFRSPPAEDLARHGYVRDVDGATTYFAPDVDALLSDEFLATHCFGVAPAPDDADFVSLSFRPVDGREVPDIFGAFRIDGRTSQLRELTFRYTGLERDIDTSELGGTITFGAVEGGGWIVESWNIRMPVVGLQAVSGTTDRREVITGIEEHGGEVRRVRRAGRAIWAGTTEGVLHGTVVGEGVAPPAAGVEVRLAGTSYLTRTDADGEFTLRGLPDRVYELQLHAPVLDVLGLDTVRTPVRPFAPGEASTLESSVDRIVVRLPTLESDAARRCQPLRDPETMAGMVSGTVMDEQTDVRVPDAVVRASWRRVRSIDAGGYTGDVEWRETVTDPGGRFVFCDLPTDVGVTVVASAFGRSSAGRDVLLGEELVRDIRLSVAAGDPIVVTGLVRSASGAPLPGAEVRIGSVFTLSDDDGRFRAGDLLPGSYPLTVSHLSRTSAGASVHVAGGAHNFFEIVMPEAAFELEGLSVEVERGARARYRTMDTRVDVMTREQIEVAAFGATSVAAVLRNGNVPGLTSYETQFYVSDDRRNQTRLGICIQLGRNAGAECRMPEVYLNGVRLDRPEFELLSLDVMTMDRIELLSAIEAQTLYPNARYGVLLIYTR